MLQVAPGSHWVVQLPPAQSKLHVAPLAQASAQLPPEQSRLQTAPGGQSHRHPPCGHDRLHIELPPQLALDATTGPDTPTTRGGPATTIGAHAATTTNQLTKANLMQPPSDDGARKLEVRARTTPRRHHADITYDARA
jgi:hypothetical protein